MINTVIIGCGRIAQNHINALKQIPDAAIVGVCDHKLEKAQALGQTLGCPGFDDAEKMLTECKPQAAIICVPTFVHEEYVTLCARHGVNVLCEKPLERTAPACRRIIDTAKEAGIVFMTAQVVRYWPGFKEIKEMMDRGEFGTVYSMRFRRVTSRDDAVATWLNMPKLGGGALHDMLVHDVDFVRYVAGPFESGYANATKDEFGCYNNVMANMVCKNGIHATAEASFTMQTGYPFSFSVSIIASEATLEYAYHAGIRIADTDESESSLRIWRKGKGLEVMPFEDEDAFLRQMRCFLSCVRENKQPTLITPEETNDVMLMIDALHQSAHTNEVVHLEGYTPFDFKE